MSKHTPGPWRVEAGTRIMPPYNATQLPIAKMGRLQHESKIEPNARLIAAAPELLEALEMVRDADDDNGRKIPSLARAKIDAAIAKAKGER